MVADETPVNALKRADVVLVDDELCMITGVHIKLVNGVARPGYRVQPLEEAPGERDVPAEGVQPTGLPRPCRADLASGVLRLGPGVALRVPPALENALAWEIKYAYR
jgi:hypothetical protein